MGDVPTLFFMFFYGSPAPLTRRFGSCFDWEGVVVRPSQRVAPFFDQVPRQSTTQSAHLSRHDAWRRAGSPRRCQKGTLSDCHPREGARGCSRRRKAASSTSQSLRSPRSVSRSPAAGRSSFPPRSGRQTHFARARERAPARAVWCRRTTRAFRDRSDFP